MIVTFNIFVRVCEALAYQGPLLVCNPRLGRSGDHIFLHADNMTVSCDARHFHSIISEASWIRKAATRLAIL